MSATFEPDKPLMPQLRELATKYDRRALGDLEHGKTLSPGDVHDTRVQVKYLRALWQLVRPLYDRKLAKSADASIRDAARSLAGARDLHVMRKTLDQIAEKTRRDWERDALTAVRDACFAETETAVEPPCPPEVPESFNRDLALWQGLPADIDDATLIRKGIGRTYRKARSLGMDAAASGDPDDWHRFRKWAKYLLYQLEPFHQTGVRLPLGYSTLEKLGKRLGKLHDIHVLIGLLDEKEKAQANTPAGEDISTALQVLRRTEADLIEECEKGTRHCFSAKPKTFTGELLDAWVNFRAEGAEGATARSNSKR